MTHYDILQHLYKTALDEVSVQDYTTTIPEDTAQATKLIVERAEVSKGMLTVLITLLTHKVYNPLQDIRYHQAQLPNGFSGRGIDREYVTPFMKAMSFPAMSESGWLTRSLEQPHPYTLSYPGNITPKAAKDAFLHLIDDVQCREVSAEEVLKYIFKLLIEQRDSLSIELAKPHSLSIAAIVRLLEKHFTYQYTSHGASRLPTLAIYAAYQCLMGQMERYEGKQLCPLEPHNSADLQSGRIGDIDINNENGSAFEGVEIKHEIKITAQMVRDAYEKFKVHSTDRYYILTTADMDTADWDAIEEETIRIGRIHGCQVIVNGVYSTLRYYLRLMKDSAEFIDKYVELIKGVETIKFQHKKVWNELVSEGI